jgi:hypothetical protein
MKNCLLASSGLPVFGFFRGLDGPTPGLADLFRGLMFRTFSIALKGYESPRLKGTRFPLEGIWHFWKERLGQGHGCHLVMPSTRAAIVKSKGTRVKGKK